MKTNIILFILLVIVCITTIVVSCAPPKDSSSSSPSNTTSTQEQTIFTPGRQVYIVTYEIRQSHISMDMSKHLKDELNAITIDIPVDEEYYNALTIGQKVKDDFRMGSLVMKGSWGKWKISVKNKRVEVIQ